MEDDGVAMLEKDEDSVAEEDEDDEEEEEAVGEAAAETADGDGTQELRYCEQCYRTKPVSEFQPRPDKRKEKKRKLLPVPKKLAKLCLNCRHNKLNAAKRLEEAKENGAYETSFLTRSKRLITYHHAYIVTIPYLTTTQEETVDYEAISKICTANMKSLVYNETVKEVHGQIRTTTCEGEKKVYIEFGMHLAKFLSADWFKNKLREVNMELFTPAECVGCLIEDFIKFKNGEQDDVKPSEDDKDEGEASVPKEYDQVIEPVTLPEMKEKKKNAKVWNTMKIRRGALTITNGLLAEKRFGILETKQEKLSRAVIYLVRKYPGQVNMFASPKSIIFFFWFHRLCTHEEFLIIQEEAENPSEISDVEFWNKLPSFVMFMREIKTGVTLITKKDIETYKKLKEKATVPDLRPLKNSHALRGLSDIIRKIEQPKNRIDKYLGPWRCAFCKLDHNIDTTLKSVVLMMNHIQLKHAIWNQDETTVNFMDFTERMISSIGGGDSLGGWEMLWERFKQERNSGNE